MKERGIIFSAPMVLALLDGRKTQTRRIASTDPETTRVRWVENEETVPRGRYTGWIRECAAPLLLPMTCRFACGDRLWVKEGWAAQHRFDDRKPREIPVGSKLHYRASSAGPSGLMWRTPLFMPRWASRITLEITAVRVERLNDISEEDARAEGVTPLPNADDGDCWTDGTHRTAFEYLWGRLNGFEGESKARAPWASNPFVWVLSFARICQCETELADPGPTHLPSCRFSDPQEEECSF